jgi:hypothetical protein
MRQSDRPACITRAFRCLFWSKEEETMRKLLTRITLGATFATTLAFGACFERICSGDLTGRPILQRICSFEPPQG